MEVRGVLGNWRQATPPKELCITALTNHSCLRQMYLGFAIYNYNTGSALIAYGLSAKQALAAGILSPIVLVTMCILCGVSLARGQHLSNGSSLLTVPSNSGLAVLITSPTPLSADWPGVCAEAGLRSSSG